MLTLLRGLCHLDFYGLGHENVAMELIFCFEVTTYITTTLQQHYKITTLQYYNNIHVLIVLAQINLVQVKRTIYFFRVPKTGCGHTDDHTDGHTLEGCGLWN